MSPSFLSYDRITRRAGSPSSSSALERPHAPRRPLALALVARARPEEVRAEAWALCVRRDLTPSRHRAIRAPCSLAPRAISPSSTG